ncbi:MAG TPA: hypothetical protein PKK17_11765 [Sphingorhabdus lacus]|nr:hypothetical protein [Sphingorhabdus lacus]HRH14034.1 hypothetical protein [Azonexus sp.]
MSDKIDAIGQKILAPVPQKQISLEAKPEISAIGILGSRLNDYA